MLTFPWSYISFGQTIDIVWQPAHEWRLVTVKEESRSKGTYWSSKGPVLLSKKQFTLKNWMPLESWDCHATWEGEAWMWILSTSLLGKEKKSGATSERKIAYTQYQNIDSLSNFDFYIGRLLLMRSEEQRVVERRVVTSKFGISQSGLLAFGQNMGRYKNIFDVELKVSQLSISYFIILINRHSLRRCFIITHLIVFTLCSQYRWSKSSFGSFFLKSGTTVWVSKLRYLTLVTYPL